MHDAVPTIARGTPDVFGVFVVATLVCFFHLHARLRMRLASGVPCALSFEGSERDFVTARPRRKEQGGWRVASRIVVITGLDPVIQHLREKIYQ